MATATELIYWGLFTSIYMPVTKREQASSAKTRTLPKEEDSRSQEWISINILESQSSLIEPKILRYSIKQHCRYCVQRRMEQTRPGKVRKRQCIQVRKRWLLWEPKRNYQQLLRLLGGVCFSHEVCYYCILLLLLQSTASYNDRSLSDILEAVELLIKNEERAA